MVRLFTASSRSPVWREKISGSVTSSEGGGGSASAEGTGSAPPACARGRSGRIPSKTIALEIGRIFRTRDGTCSDRVGWFAVYISSETIAFHNFIAATGLSNGCHRWTSPHSLNHSRSPWAPTGYAPAPFGYLRESGAMFMSLAFHRYPRSRLCERSPGT